MKKCIIYKIVCNNIEVPYIYVGSTKNFNKRKKSHKYALNNQKLSHMKEYRIINENKGWDNWTMIILETRLCESKAEAVEIERRYYDELNANAMNSIRPMCTIEELKEYQAEYKKLHRTANKEKIAARQSEKIHCEACNCYNSRCHISRHNKSPKH